MTENQDKTANRLREKYGGEGQAGNAESETIQEEEITPVRERSSFTMYPADSDKHEIDALYLRLDKEYRDEYGETLEKNRLYYPAVLRYGYENPDAIRIALELPVPHE